MATNKIQINLRLKPEIHRKLVYISKIKERSINAQIEYLSKEYIKEYENKNGLITDEEIEKILKP